MQRPETGNAVTGADALFRLHVICVPGNPVGRGGKARIFLGVSTKLEMASDSGQNVWMFDLLS